MNYITVSLHNFFNAKIGFLVGANPDLLNKCRLYFNNYLLYLHKHEDAINNYAFGSPKKKMVIKTTMEGITFCFILNKDRTSSFHIDISKSESRDFDAGFLVHRLKKKHGYVYILQSDMGYKIGCTAKFYNRMKLFSVKMPFKFKIHSTIKCFEYTTIERKIHLLSSDKNINGEWFDLDDNDFIKIDAYLSELKLERTPFDNKLIIS